jgi:hypothetical protein
MESSKLYKALNSMPKGAIHHLHTTAANPVDAYVKLTYDDRVYYSAKERLFKVYPLHEDVPDGYLKCTKIREYSKSKEEFDAKMRNEILLGKHQCEGDSHDIWKHFQHKFTKVGELGKFYPFFKELTKTALESCIAQNVFVVEYRHISGMIFDEHRQQLPFIEEMRIIRSIVDELKQITPHFDFKLILTGLKIVGKKHID